MKDPVCGMQVNKDSAVKTVELEGVTYGFCSQHCYDQFSKNPEQFVTPEEVTPHHSHEHHHHDHGEEYSNTVDPVCGMAVPASQAGKVEYKGQTYYLCCPLCQAEFEKCPDKYV